MKNETIDALDLFIREVTHAIRVALPDAPVVVEDVEKAAKELRYLLGEEEV